MSSAGYVYVIWDRDDPFRCLYVGKTTQARWLNRTRDHLEEKPWADRIGVIEPRFVGPFDTDEDTLAAERFLIGELDPVHNVQHKGKRFPIPRCLGGSDVFNPLRQRLERELRKEEEERERRRRELPARRALVDRAALTRAAANLNRMDDVSSFKRDALAEWQRILDVAKKYNRNLSSGEVDRAMALAAIVLNFTAEAA